MPTDLADLYRAKGDYARAEPLLRQAAEILRKARGESDPDYARALGGLAVLYKALGAITQCRAVAPPGDGDHEAAEAALSQTPITSGA